MEYILGVIAIAALSAAGGAFGFAWWQARRAAAAEESEDRAEAASDADDDRADEAEEKLEDARDEITRGQEVIRELQAENLRTERELEEVRAQRDRLLHAAGTRDPVALNDATRDILRRLEELRKAQGGGGSGPRPDGGDPGAVHGRTPPGGPPDL